MIKCDSAPGKNGTLDSQPDLSRAQVLTGGHGGPIDPSLVGFQCGLIVLIISVVWCSLVSLRLLCLPPEGWQLKREDREQAETDDVAPLYFSVTVQGLGLLWC